MVLFLSGFRPVLGEAAELYYVGEKERGERKEKRTIIRVGDILSRDRRRGKKKKRVFGRSLNFPRSEKKKKKETSVFWGLFLLGHQGGKDLRSYY